MSYPHTRAALLDMVRRVALSVPVARSVARKAGLRRGAAPVGIRTIISAYVDHKEEPHGRQYLADLSGVTRWRLVSQSSAPVYVMQSQEGGNALAAGTYYPLEDDATTTPFGADSTTSTDWMDLNPFLPPRAGLRFPPVAERWQWSP